MTAGAVYSQCLSNDGCDIRAHLPYLRSVAKGNVLEIGVRGGASTSALLMGLEDRADSGLLYSIDIDPGCVANFASHPLWKFFDRDSTKPETIRAIYELDTMFDVLFIDGDHSYQAVISDLLNYSPFVKPGGLILMHDVSEPTLADVRRAMESFLELCKWESEIHEGSHGLAVIKVPDASV